MIGIYEEEEIRAIGVKIREHTGTEKQYTTAEMPEGIDEVYRKGFAVSYDSGYADGKQDGISEGEAQGAVNEKKRFWGILQDYGNRTNFTYTFYIWRVDIIDPQYDVRPQIATNMFQQVQAVDGKNLNIPEIEARNGIKFDFSKCTTMANMIAWGAVEDLGFVDTTSCPNPNYAFSNSGYLKRVSIAIKEDGSQNFSGAFDYTNILEDFTIVSGYFGSNLNFQYCKLLSVESMESILTHLKNYYGSADAYTRTILFDNDCWNRLNSADPLSIVEDYGDYQTYIFDVLGWNF